MLSLLFWSVVARSSGFFCVDSSGRACPPTVSGRSFAIEVPTSFVEITSAEDIEHPIDLSLVERRFEITGNGNTVRLFTSNSSTARVLLKNVTVVITGDFRVAELDLESSVLVGMNSSVAAGAVTIKTSELVDVASVKAQFATIEIDKKGSNGSLFLEIEKVETEETQVVIRNSVSVDLVFGVNSLLFLLPESNVSLVQVFGVDYPRIEVFHISGQMLVSCCSNMIPSVLLSPVIHVDGGVCVFGGENWPSRPRPRGWYWRFEHFFEGDDRTIWVVPAPEAELVIQGKEIPISIRADDGDPVILNVAQVECGISGGIVLNTNTESVIQYFGRKPAVFNIGFLVEDGGKLEVSSELLTLRFDVCNFSDVVTGNGTLECQTINDTKRNVEQRVTLMPNGTIYMKLLMPFNELYTKIKKGYLSQAHFPDWVYTPEGNVNYLQALKFATSWMDNNRLKMAGIFQVLKRFGNTVHPVNITSDPQEQYHLHIERDDIPLNIFYSNPYKYGRPLIYSTSFNMTNWDVTVEPYPAHNARLPVKLSEMEMKPSFKTISVNQNEEGFRWQLPEYPSSSAEVFIFCTDEALHKGLSYADGLLFHYVRPQSANKVASMLTNRKTKNVIFFMLSDPSPVGINLQGFRSDVNIMIVGLTINAMKMLPRIDFSALAHIDIVGSFGSLYAAFVAGNRLKITATKNVGLFMTNYSTISIAADNIVTDFTGFTPTLSANQLLFVPVNSAMQYANLSSVKFVDDGWDCQYEFKGKRPRTIRIPKSCAKERLNILGNIHDLTLHMNTTAVTPTIIGPEYFDPKTGTSELIGAPLLSDEESEPLELIGKTIKIVSEMLSKSETGESHARVRFTGNWTNASDGVRVRVSDNAVVEDFPVDSVDNIEVLSDRRIQYVTLDADNLEVVTPQLIRGSKEFVLPDGKRVSFNNITFLSRLAKLAVSSGALDVKHIRTGKDASANLSLVKLGTSIRMLERSSLRIDSLSSSKEHIVEFTGRLGDRFPFLSLGPVDSIPKMVVNIEESECELDQLLTQSHRIVEIESNTDRCSELTLELHARPDFSEEANVSAVCHFDGKQMLVTVNTTLYLDGQISRFSFEPLNETDEEFDETSTPVLEEKPYLQRMGVAFARIVIIIMVVAAVVFVFIPRPVPGQFPPGLIDANEEQSNLDRNDDSRVPVVPEDESDPIL